MSLRPVVLVCLDGMGPGYVEAALEAGLWPRLGEWAAAGGHVTAAGILPSFTNPNNLSLVTGLRSDGHGICANHFYDRALGRETALDDPAYLRAETRLAALERAGARVAAVTAKEKLRRLLGAGRSGPSFSAERADGGFAAWGIERLDAFVRLPGPEIYSAEASLFVLEAGVALLARCRPDLLYLSTTDYLQHRFAPGAQELAGFSREIDRCLAALAAAGAMVAVTADHGMSAKPRLVFLGEELPDARVVLPITDPYVRHHGALGGCAFVDHPEPARARAALAQLPGVASAHPREEAAVLFGLPEDRIGDLVVFAEADTALGRTRAEHDLTGLPARLRSHGGPSEQQVPVLTSEPLTPPPPNSRDLLDAALRAAGWPPELAGRARERP